MPLPQETPEPTPPLEPEEPASPPVAIEPIPEPETPPAPIAELPAPEDKEEPAKPLELPSEPNLAQLDPSEINPETLTASQAVELTQAAFETLSVAEPGSAEYEKALEQLLVVAEADDPELPEELANIPLIGGVATAVLDAFNNLGNLGADISPKERKRGQQIVLGTVIVGNIAASSLFRR
jgi:hypothetical protein